MAFQKTAATPKILWAVMASRQANSIATRISGHIAYGNTLTTVSYNWAPAKGNSIDGSEE